MDRAQFDELIDARTLDQLAKGHGQSLAQAQYTAVKEFAWDLASANANTNAPHNNEAASIAARDWSISPARSESLGRAALGQRQEIAGSGASVTCHLHALQRQIEVGAKEGFAQGLAEGMSQAAQRSAELEQSVQALLDSDPNISQVSNEELRDAAMDERAEPVVRAQAESVLRVRDALEDVQSMAKLKRNNTMRSTA